LPSLPEPVSSSGPDKRIEAQEGNPAKLEKKASTSKTIAASTVIFCSNDGKRFHAGLAILWAEEKRQWTMLLYAQVAGQRKVLWNAAAGKGSPVLFRCDMCTPGSGALPSGQTFHLTHAGRRVGSAQCGSRMEALRWTFVSTYLRSLQTATDISRPSDATLVVDNVPFGTDKGGKKKKIKTKHAVTVCYQAWLVNWEDFSQKSQFDVNEDAAMMNSVPDVLVEDSKDATPTCLNGLIKGMKVDDQKIVVTTPTSTFSKTLANLAQGAPPKCESSGEGIASGNITGILSGQHQLDLAKCLLILLIRPVKVVKKEKVSSKKKTKSAAVANSNHVPHTGNPMGMVQNVQPTPKFDTKPLLDSLSKLNKTIKELPATQIGITQSMLRDIFTSFKSMFMEHTSDDIETAKKAAIAILKKTLRAMDKAFVEGNQVEDTGTILDLRNCFKTFLAEFGKMKKENFLSTNERASLEMQLAQTQKLLHEAKAESASGKARDNEIEQLRNDYTETLTAGMETEKKMEALKEKLSDAEELSKVFESGLSGMKKAFEDERLKCQKLEAANRILQVVFEIGVPRMWGSDIKKILSLCDQKVGSNPTEQLRKLVANPPLDDDDDDDD